MKQFNLTSIFDAYYAARAPNTVENGRRRDLKRILISRWREAFRPGVVDEDVVEACLDYAAEQSRDIRRMVDLLRVCGNMLRLRATRGLR